MPIDSPDPGRSAHRDGDAKRGAGLRSDRGVSLRTERGVSLHSDRIFALRAVVLFAGLAAGLTALREPLRSAWAPRTPVARLDRAVLVDLHRTARDHSGFVAVMRWISDVGAVMWWVVFVPVVLVLIWRQRYRVAVFVAVTALGSRELNGLVKSIVGRTRPVLPDPVATAADASFPSGHTQSAVVGVCLVWVLVRRTSWGGSGLAARHLLVAAALALTGFIVVALIAFSRLALGVHYLSDIVGAVVIGLAWVLSMTAFHSAWQRAC